MKFLIHSAWSGNPHIPEAKEEKYKCYCYWDEQTTEKDGWFIEINAIEDLLKIIKDVNHDLILSFVDKDRETEIPEITIYDDYIE